MSEAPTHRSGSSWFPGQRRLLIALTAVLVAVIMVGIVMRSAGSPRSARPDLGPGPVRGVRLTEFQPGEGDRSCFGVSGGLPVVRLVEQVDVEQLRICLGPGRQAGTFPLEPFVLDASSPDGEQLLDAWAAAWSLPDEQLPWWEDSETVECPAIGVLVPPSAITVAGVTMRPVPPYGPCQPMPLALTALADISQAARPAS